MGKVRKEREGERIKLKKVKEEGKRRWEKKEKGNG